MEVDLTGAPATMQATLYARALDARAPRPVLGDAAALDAVSRIEYDFARTGITASTAAGVAMRAKLLDDWTADFLSRHPSATVLHLACGLVRRVTGRFGRFGGERLFDVYGSFGIRVQWVEVRGRGALGGAAADRRRAVAGTRADAGDGAVAEGRGRRSRAAVPVLRLL